MELRDYVRVLVKSWVMIVPLPRGTVAATASRIPRTPRFIVTSNAFASHLKISRMNWPERGSFVTMQRVRPHFNLVNSLIALLPVVGNPASQSLTAVLQKIGSPVAGVAASRVRLTCLRGTPVPSNAVHGHFGLDPRPHNEPGSQSIADCAELCGIDTRAHPRPPIVRVDPHRRRAESIRTLRTSLKFLEANRSRRRACTPSSRSRSAFPVMASRHPLLIPCL